MPKDLWSGRLFHSDCLVLLERVPSEVAQLVYLDPPWFPELPGDEDLPAYMRYLANVLQQTRRVLKETGSLYFHSTPSLAGSIRFTLDHIFGSDMFMEEIIIPLASPYQRFARRNQQHDSIYVYGKTIQSTLYPPTRALTKEEVQKRWPSLDEDGRRYRTVTLLQTGVIRPSLRFEWHNFMPSEGQVWRFSKARLDEMNARGEIIFKSEGVAPRRKDVMEEPVKPIGSIWSDLNPIRLPSEEAGRYYPTQKPIALMQRIIEMSSVPGDLVIDPFCGTGTTLFAAGELGRNWIGGDKSTEAIDITTTRLKAEAEWGSSSEVISEEALVRQHCVVDGTYHPILTGFEDFIGTNEPFRLNHALPVEETRHYEFKEVKGANPINIIKNTADEYVVAFLNSSGGRIFWGVRDSDRFVVGVKLQASQRDQLKRDIISKMSEIQPAVDPTRYRVLLHDVIDGYRRVPDLCVVEIAVPRVESTIPYATGGRDVWVKTDAGKRRLEHLELVAWIQGRMDSAVRQTPMTDPPTDYIM